jgi:trehalose 6-phosphate synthase/phosphatase
MEKLLDRLHAAQRLRLLLDYDGTLVPFATTPDLARPDGELLDLLRALARRPDTEVHVISGRARDSLSDFLGPLPIHLHAEHGLWYRPPGQVGRELAEVATAWKESIRPILHDFAARTPGALVEEKPAGLAWHYRLTEPELGHLRAAELQSRLQTLVHRTPVEILLGHLVIELRVRNVNKGLVVAALRDGPDLLVAVGDDLTDEDMFRALPADALSVRVGPGDSAARFRLPDHTAVRMLFRSLVPV